MLAVVVSLPSASCTGGNFHVATSVINASRQQEHYNLEFIYISLLTVLIGCTTYIMHTLGYLLQRDLAT